MNTLLKVLKVIFRIIVAIFKFIFRIFSPYVHPYERKVDKFLKNLHAGSNFFTVQRKLLEIMQENLAVLSLWLEKKSKGYRYLKKSVRRRLYKNAQILITDFEEFCKENPVDENRLKHRLANYDLDLSINDLHDKFAYISQIMDYLSPGERYEYLESSSFGKLLKNPKTEKLQGDCNQIVTLYVYLYSLKFPIDELKIKLPHEHICLHFHNVDIEATNATFHNYEEYEDILPITELISTNLLDVSDFRENQVDLSERVLLKSAQLAFLISSKRELVTKNLRVTYNNLAWEAAKSNNYQSAVFFMEKTEQPKELQKIYHNAVLYYLEHKNFSKARYFAGGAQDPKLFKWVDHDEGVYYYEKKSWKKALNYFKKNNEKDWINACYQGEYYELYKKVENVTLLKDAVKYKHIYKKMLTLAQKMNDGEREDWVRSILDNI